LLLMVFSFACEAPQRGLDASSAKRAGARVNRFRVEPERKAVCASSAQRPLSFWGKPVDDLRVPNCFRTASIEARGGSAKEDKLSDPIRRRRQGRQMPRGAARAVKPASGLLRCTPP
jgi:hypothetical protein